MPTARLDDRALISVSGPEAEHFLQNIITVDLDGLAQGEARPSALLTPQGKILFDFLVSREGPESLLLECRADVAEDFVRRLMLYRLRAKAQIEKRDQAIVSISWNADSSRSPGDSDASGIDSTASSDESGEGWLADRRFPPEAGVKRRYENVAPTGDIAAWHALRISRGVAESGLDYELGDAFPHDVLLDQNGGVGFRKGCYVGQEVVSRMQHRGTARRRILIAEGEAPLPPAGTPVTADGRQVGAMGSSQGPLGLALVRIDKVKAAMDSGEAVTAGDAALALSIPPGARFAFPDDPAESA